MKNTHTGFVLGIDVGFSRHRATTCFCLLSWDEKWVSFECQLASAHNEERKRALLCLVQEGTVLQAIAIDGPLVKNLRNIDHYHAAEAILSRRVFQRRGKPGQTSSPMGQKLHSHATNLAKLILEESENGNFKISKTKHFQAISDSCIIEAFSNQFLGALIPESSLPELNRDASDRYWEVAITKGLLENFLQGFLPKRKLRSPLNNFDDHDHRAGVVCALTALCIAGGNFISVGDPEDGDIILPPASYWGKSAEDEISWMEKALRISVPLVRRDSRRNHPNHRNSRVVKDSEEWF